MSNRMGAVAILTAAAIAGISAFLDYVPAQVVTIFILSLGLITLGLVVTAIVKMGRPSPDVELIRNHIRAAGACTSMAIVAGGVAIAIGVY